MQPPDDLTARVQAAFQARLPDMAVRLVGHDADACKRILREEMVGILKELRLDVESDPEAQARLDGAVADALAEMDRLSAEWNS